jgi:hypothetical protein
MADNKKIVGFKKFSDIKSSSSKIEEVDASLPESPETDSDRPMIPNLSEPTKKVEKPISQKNIQPTEHDEDFEQDEENDEYPEGLPKNESAVKTYGKVAKFPRNVKASKAFNFLENVKVSKKSIWYIVVEQQTDELQLVKYNYKEGVDLNKFINELKSYYLGKHKDNKVVCEAVSKISIDGNDKYSKITNIPKIKVEDKLLITKITEDLIKLLSK